MVDLNLWELTYELRESLMSDAVTDTVSLEFGTHESGYPFTSQVVIGAPAAEYGDVANPLGDGMTPGRDFLRSRIIGFAGAHLDAAPIPATRRWTQRMDASAVLESVWNGEGVRSDVARVARLTNLDRDRSVYGRPRNYIPDLTLARRGWTEWTAEFHTVDHRFYGPEQSLVVGGNPPLGDASANLPNAPAGPVVTGSNDGTDRPFPRVSFQGTATALVNPKLYVYDGDGDLLWWVGIAGSLSAYTFHNGDVWNPSTGVTRKSARLDARPWMRTITASDTSYAGIIRGARMDDMRLPLGDFGLAWSATSGTGSCTVTWSDVYGGL